MSDLLGRARNEGAGSRRVTELSGLLELHVDEQHPPDRLPGLGQFWASRHALGFKK